MSDTPSNADNCMKLLDNGWTIQMYRNGLGSYTAVAIGQNEKMLTDDFTPSQALYRLTEKVFGNIV
jgi:hypothetical protein